MGKIVLVADDAGWKLAQDAEQYPDTKPELNVRILSNIEDLDLSMEDVRKIHPLDNGYGCSWGSASKLYPVTADQISALRCASLANIEAQNKK